MWLHKQHMKRSTSASSLRRFARRRALVLKELLSAAVAAQPVLIGGADIGLHYPLPFPAVVACLLAASTSYRECNNGTVVPTLTALWRKREFRCFGQIQKNFTHILFAFGKIFGHVFLI